MLIFDLKQKIFSVETTPVKTHKVVKIFGVKFKIRCDGNRKACNRLIADIRKNCVLIVETNNCHYEVIPGYAKYFTELGYNVDIAVCGDERLDFLSDALRSVRVYNLGEKDIERLLSAAAICKYRYIVFNSAIKYVGGGAANAPEMPLVTDYYKNIAADISKMIFVQHHMERRGINRNQIALVDLHNSYSSRFYTVNPHYFGKVKITQKNKDITKFIVVGGISSWRKNYDLLIASVRRLAKLTDRFKVIVVGAGQKLQIDEDVAAYFDIRGRLPYREMFAAMEEADFFLCLLDPENPDHDRYVSMGTSGSFQLIYGFAKLCLIQAKFAAAYEFNHTNSLVYENNADLVPLMQQAIEMDGTVYARLQSELKNKAQNIRERSLRNLKLLLETIDSMC